MAVYRFRVRFEEHFDVTRDIDVKASQTFQHFYDCINTSIGFDGKAPASFYLSDENWKKGKEFSNNQERIDSGKAVAMKDAKLTASIYDPHQKIYLEMDSDPVWEFQIELMKITNLESKTDYPRCVKSVGNAPKQYGATKLGAETKEFDFMKEEKFPDESDEEMAEGTELSEESDELPLDEADLGGEVSLGEDEVGFGEEGAPEPENEI